ncbi:hypothetical protein ABLN67_12800, partial [Mycobacterium tuberculosis]
YWIGDRYGCLTVSSIGGNGFSHLSLKRFRVFRAPLPGRAAAASASASAASASAANAIASACDVPASDGGSVVSAIVDTARQYHSRLNSGIAHSIAHC